MKQFDIPEFYRSPVITVVKQARQKEDPRKKDFTPALLDYGPVQFIIPRHFGFCYGVENAIEIAYKAMNENKGKRIFLLSQMIHNPGVNKDLQENGIDFIQDTLGNQLIDWDEIHADDVVIIPAFGTTLEIEKLLEEKGVTTSTYNTTCPFVERVWNRTEKLGKDEYAIVIHGKPQHEETRATFSHSSENAPSLIVRDMKEAQIACSFIKGERNWEEFDSFFEGRYSDGFIPREHLLKVGVVNQTTMLAADTQEIADLFKQTMIDVFGADNLKSHFADTRDTLCYATYDNQRATNGTLEVDAHMALVVGGYNSSNTSHIVELCERKFPTYFISGAEEIDDDGSIHHFDYPNKQMLHSTPELKGDPFRIVLTSGASCPDSAVERVMKRMLEFFPGSRSHEEVIEHYRQLN